MRFILASASHAARNQANYHNGLGCTGLVTLVGSTEVWAEVKMTVIQSQPWIVFVSVNVWLSWYSGSYAECKKQVGKQLPVFFRGSSTRACICVTVRAYRNKFFIGLVKHGE